MAAAIPAAIGVGSSLIGGISSKGARKKQEEMQRQQLELLRNASIYGTEFAKSVLPDATNKLAQSYVNAGEAKDLALQDRTTAMTDYKKLLNDALAQRDALYNQGQGLMNQGKITLSGANSYLQGAGAALSDLQRFYRPFMTEGAAAIDRFLPSAQRTFEALAPEFGQVNQAYKSASQNIAEFAPRGPGRITAGNDLEIARQQGITRTFTEGRENMRKEGLSAAFQGAAGEQQRANALQSLGLGQGQLGLGTIGTGLNTIGQGTQALGTGGALAQNAFGQGQQSLGQALQAILQQMQAGQGLGQLGTSALGVGASGNAAGLSALGQTQQNNGSANQLGSYLVDFFGNKSVQDKIGGLWGDVFGGGNKKDFLTAPYNPYGNQMNDTFA